MDNFIKKELQDVPKDYISDMIFMKEYRQLLVTSWDGTISLYHLSRGEEEEEEKAKDELRLLNRLRYKVPLLCCSYMIIPSRSYSDWMDLTIYAGTIHGEIVQIDFETNRIEPIASNNDAQLGISKMIRSVKNKKLYVSSWDCLIQELDPVSNQITKKIRLEDGKKVLSMDCNDDNLIIATTSGKIKWTKLPLADGHEGERAKGMWTEVEAGLKYQLRDIKLTNDGDGYVSSSIDGRVAVEYFNDESKKFAFRCHRMNLVDMQFVFPVNTLSFDPHNNILYTGGSDGCVSVWNLDSQKKIKQFPKFNENSVVKIVTDERMLCVATSDDSFKTNAVATDALQLQPSRIYILFKM
ncbi:Bub3p NDAI_0F00920 [Naumovozyma dairenensis CBS 421]|uniref:Uncharacterized protein n=1 Tax=Naumovozyma dairenensis (strain ATCC 10597 / BCRC 20456 / CBS 421 / NBRC 0211 / NRRL Y-12639) TaxID=1071378 RepID=G0WCA0_NAUDC|nr:hypothetical protein NDAI_0F00920 [Naumovozyma dairenensis CBS 421]CCD25411.1 hypothetical protein NDAI_0F00920 [Naumovozyma dairenensis CBS 421]